MYSVWTSAYLQKSAEMVAALFATKYASLKVTHKFEIKCPLTLEKTESNFELSMMMK